MNLGTANKIFKWVLIATLTYVLISSVAMIGVGLNQTSGDYLNSLFEFATNPILALLVGILATAIVQSSSTVSSIIVGLVAGGLPVESAIPMIIGADFGTTVTNVIVSLAYVGRKQYFRRAFAAAMVHDFFNLLAVFIFLPLELTFHFMEHISGFFAGLLVGGQDISLGGNNFLHGLTSPFIGFFNSLGQGQGEVVGGIIMVIAGVIFILLSVIYIGNLLKQLMVGRAQKIMFAAIGKKPLTSIFSGMLITTIVQSSSTTTSLMVPLAGTGLFRLKQVYPFTLGSNIGTTVTALLAATAITGANAVYALQIALVFLLYNVFSVTLVYNTPVLMRLPMVAAVSIAKLADRNKLVAIIYVVGVFFAIPAFLIFIAS
ncbi:MAG: hypothetical protein KAR62_00230 [Sphingomonadales bacterium]|nr:hypothetical protein [Sphingomonadales bacterium]